MSLSNIQKFFPGAVFPIICNGPMIGAASAAMAAEVSKAGGIGESHHHRQPPMMT